MGHRVTQHIYVCDCCKNIPEDGEYLYYMGNEIICKECIDNGNYDEYIEEKETTKES